MNNGPFKLFQNYKLTSFQAGGVEGWARRAQADSRLACIFIRVGGPEVHKLRRFVALTQDVVARPFVALTQHMVGRRSTKTQGANRGRWRAGRAVNYFFCLLKYFL